jgi:tetratricopeptide (TPR) repeat protein
MGLDSLANEQIRKYADDINGYFQKAAVQGQLKQFTSSLNYYSKAIEMDPKNPFLYINRSTINSEMVDFISSIDNSVQTIVIDNTGGGKTKTKMDVRVYNYEEAIADLNKAIMLSPDLTYAYYNRANLKCMSGNTPEAIDDYSKAIQLYPYFAEAYFNRGLVQLYLKDTEKGCLDISKAGELGISDAYAIIKKSCTDIDK